jgi:hypothetical protein
MQKIDKFAHAAKVVALCLPPVVMSLIGLAALPLFRAAPPPGGAAHGRGHPAWHPYVDGVCLVSVTAREYVSFFIVRELGLSAEVFSTEWRDQ